MLLKSEVLEFRSIVKQKSKSGSIYYLVNCENDNGIPIQFYVRNIDFFPNQLSKGDKIIISFVYSKYGKEIRLSVVSVEKVV